MNGNETFDSTIHFSEAGVEDTEYRFEVFLSVQEGVKALERIQFDPKAFGYDSLESMLEDDFKSCECEYFFAFEDDKKLHFYVDNYSTKFMKDTHVDEIIPLHENEVQALNLRVYAALQRFPGIQWFPDEKVLQEAKDFMENLTDKDEKQSILTAARLMDSKQTTTLGILTACMALEEDMEQNIAKRQQGHNKPKKTERSGKNERE